MKRIFVVFNGDYIDIIDEESGKSLWEIVDDESKTTSELFKSIAMANPNYAEFIYSNMKVLVEEFEHYVEIMSE